MHFGNNNNAFWQRGEQQCILTTRRTTMNFGNEENDNNFGNEENDNDFGNEENGNEFWQRGERQ